MASDVMVLGAAVTVAGVGLKSLASSHMPAPIKSTLGGTQNLIEDDGVV